MKLFRHVLVGTDFSEPAGWAVASGVGLAQTMGARLTLATVVQPYRPGTLASASLTGASVEAPFIEEAQRELERLKEATVPPTVGVTLETMVDLSPAGAITNAAEELGVDLIVIGTRGQGGFRRLLLGSVAEQVVRHASCPVLTLGRRAFDERGRQSGVMVAADLTEGSEPALDAGVQLARAYGVPLELVHVAATEADQPPAEQALRRLAGGATAPAPSTEDPAELPSSEALLHHLTVVVDE
ncbi:MAG: universal stress protein, partial [Myxococcota bacterium]